MDKSKWEYRNFEKCIEKIPHPKQLKTSEYNSEGRYPIISQEETLISGYSDKQDIVNHFSKPVVIFGDHTRTLKYIDFDFIVGADGVKILIPKDDLIGKFLFYYLKWYKIPSLGYSRHYKLLKEISVPIPPILIQQDIVSELDQLSAIISLKQQQMKEYDALAQSLFYEMFGDMDGSEKSFEKKIFGECFKLKSGDSLTAKNIVKGPYAVFGGNGIVGYHSEFNAEGQQIIIGRVGALCGNVHLIDGKNFITDNAFILSDSIGFDKVYLLYFLSMLNLRDYAREAMQPVISNKTLKGITIPLPPLSLQRFFAEKVKAIEHQKSLLKQSIAETQTLLDSRMQEYFS